MIFFTLMCSYEETTPPGNVGVCVRVRLIHRSWIIMRVNVSRWIILWSVMRVLISDCSHPENTAVKLDAGTLQKWPETQLHTFFHLHYSRPPRRHGGPLMSRATASTLRVLLCAARFCWSSQTKEYISHCIMGMKTCRVYYDSIFIRFM